MTINLDTVWIFLCGVLIGSQLFCTIVNHFYAIKRRPRFRVGDKIQFASYFDYKISDISKVIVPIKGYYTGVILEIHRDIKYYGFGFLAPKEEYDTVVYLVGLTMNTEDVDEEIVGRLHNDPNAFSRKVKVYDASGPIKKIR